MLVNISNAFPKLGTSSSVFAMHLETACTTSSGRIDVIKINGRRGTIGLCFTFSILMAVANLDESCGLCFRIVFLTGSIRSSNLLANLQYGSPSTDKIGHNGALFVCIFGGLYMLDHLGSPDSKSFVVV